jgi:hypothetical protein
MVALNLDYTVLNGTASTALRFEFLCKFRKLFTRKGYSAY